MFDDSPQAPIFYDTDRLHKATLATHMQTSPIRYSIVRTTSPRFSPDQSDAVPFGCYNIDVANKKTLESTLRDNRRFYASSFQSAVPRFTRPWTSPATDVLYDVERLNDSRPATIERSLEWSHQNYAILRSRYKRFTEPHTEGPDVMYDTDRLHKSSLVTSMEQSPISYRNLAAGSSRTDATRRLLASTAHLGPGAYDGAKHPNEVRSSQFLDARPLSSMASRTPRFGQRRGATSGLGLGSTWTPEVDNKAWGKRGATISGTQYLRPQYLPKAYVGKDGKGEGKGR